MGNLPGNHCNKFRTGFDIKIQLKEITSLLLIWNNCTLFHTLIIIYYIMVYNT